MACASGAAGHVGNGPRGGGGMEVHYPWDCSAQVNRRACVRGVCKRATLVQIEEIVGKGTSRRFRVTGA